LKCKNIFERERAPGTLDVTTSPSRAAGDEVYNEHIYTVLTGVMGDDTVDDEALARALAYQEEAHAYELGIEYPTFRKQKRKAKGSSDGVKKQQVTVKPPSDGPSKPNAPPSVTLAHLIDYELITPGPDVLTTSYCDQVTTAELTKLGTIMWRDSKYQSVSAFSVAFKRSIKPDRKADDGWKSVRYIGVGSENNESKDGILLDVLKKQLLGDTGKEKADVVLAGDGAVGSVKLMNAKLDEEKAKREALKPKPPSKPLKPKLPKPVKPKKLKPEVPIKPKKPIPPPIDRPRRERKAPTRMGVNTSDLQMVECVEYDEASVGANNHGRKKSTQPFSLTCSCQAQALMDFHSHLSSDTEIIGFLGGTWDAQNKKLKITRALPARRLLSDDANVEVELDPASVPEICEKLDKNNEKVVGWYHSHPLFAIHPSLRDCENQLNYQNLFNDEGDDENNKVPFVGAIVGPYFGSNPIAEINWFHVDEKCVDEGLLAAGVTGQPRGLKCGAEEAVEDTAKNAFRMIDTLHCLQKDVLALSDVFGTGAERFDRVDLDKPWGGEKITRLEKLCVSLKSRLPKNTHSETFVDTIKKRMTETWT
tara:strand:- start:507 stop:2279 length:1773 start_codon:yes stop_codon:yes gene_type:complete